MNRGPGLRRTSHRIVVSRAARRSERVRRNRISAFRRKMRSREVGTGGEVKKEKEMKEEEEEDDMADKGKKEK